MCEEFVEDLKNNFAYQYVCAECIKDKYLKEYVQSYSSSYPGEVCFLCKNSKETLLSLGELLGYIRECICKEYKKSIDVLFWDSKEGGYQGTQEDAYDLTEDLLEDEDEQLKELVRERVLESESWTPIASENFVEEDLLHYSWSQFEQSIKFKYRYTFLAFPFHSKVNSEQEDSIQGTLDMLCGLVRELDLFSTIRKGKSLYRVRKFDTSLSDIKELCPPPVNKAQDNRMSPRGISMFYCSDSEEVACLEVECKQGDKVNVATFTPLKDLTVLDLTVLPGEYSLFSDASGINPSIRFFHAFAERISRPKEEDPFCYIPTQIITEYFRYFLRDSKGKAIDGICYYSSRQNDEINYVFFFGPEGFKGIEGVLDPVFEMTSVSFKTIK